MNHRFHLHRVAACLVVLIGCGRVEVKQDSPQATVATLIKVLEADKPEILAQLVDPTLMRSDARSIACLDVTLKELSCDAALLDCLQRHATYCNTPEGCPVKVKGKECTCGQKGADAAGKAKPFVESSFCAGLKAMKMTPAKCAIATVAEPDDLTASDPLITDTCGELTLKDQLSVVSFTCEGHALQLILRKKDNAWLIAGIPEKTRQLLDGTLQSAQGAEYSKKLNSDLK